jgi:hypothetical protein
MFMITKHCSSTIHQKSVPEDIIHQVHDPHRSDFAASINLLSWWCCSTMFNGKNSSVNIYWMWRNKLFLCWYKWLKQTGHLNQCLTLWSLTGSSSSLLLDGQDWPSFSLSSSFLAASFSAASFSAASSSTASFSAASFPAARLLLSCLLGRLLHDRLFFQLFNLRTSNVWIWIYI